MTYSTPWTGPASANTRASCSSDVSLYHQLPKLRTLSSLVRIGVVHIVYVPGS
jgi:hypothetical protein